MNHIDINCDLGEGANDSMLMPLVTSANIACGGHAGDESTMRRAIELALEAGANIGAHPSYEDRLNFGRAELHLPAEQLRRSLVKQIESLKRIVAEAGGFLRHVKPHGALYNVAIRDPTAARSIIDAVWEVDPKLAIVTMPHGVLFEQAAETGIEAIAEGFADRTYQADGTLTPRSEPNALLTREMDAADQVLWMVRDGAARSIDGKWMPMKVQTICVHGDGRSAVAMLRLLRSALAAAGIAAKPF